MFCEFFNQFISYILCNLVTCQSLINYRCTFLTSWISYINRENIILLCYEFELCSEFAPRSCYSGLTCWQHSVQPELVQSVDGTKHTIKWSTNLVTRLKLLPNIPYTMKAHMGNLIDRKKGERTTRCTTLHGDEHCHAGLHVNMWPCQVTCIACDLTWSHVHTHNRIILVHFCSCQRSGV